MTLSDVCTKISDCPHSTAVDEGKGHPLLRTPNIGKGVLLLDGVHRVSDAVYKQRTARAVPEKGDLVLAREAPAGNVAIIDTDERVCLGQRTVLLKVDKEKADPRFLAYYLLSPKSQYALLGTANGATVAHVNMSTIARVPVELPSLEEQKEVAQILEVIDSKIGCNKRINDNLAQQASEIYEYMFITNVDSSWKIGKLSDIVTIRYGKDHKKLADGIYPVYGSGGIMRYVERPLYTKESVLIPRKGTLNNVIYVNQPFWSVDTMFYTEMRMPNVAKFVYNYLKTINLAALNSGSAVPSMTTDILNAIELIIPHDSALKKFEEMVSPMYLEMQKNNSQIEILGKLRDILLPKLLSGEIGIPSSSLSR